MRGPRDGPAGGRTGIRRPTPTTQSLSAGQARRIALAAQGFAGARLGASNWRRVRSLIDRLSLLQLDSVNVVVRTHYMPAFSRIGAYPRATFDRKAFDPRRRELFEYWGHEASLLPFRMHPLLRWRMARARRYDGVWGGVARFARDNPDHLKAVLREIRRRGPSSARDLATGQPRRGGMWDWHSEKMALEFLFWIGELTAHSRRGFERVYDLTENVLPAAVLALPTPDEADAHRRLLAVAAGALGVATASDLRDYFRLPARDAAPRIGELVEDGTLQPVAVEGWRTQAYLAADARLPRRVGGEALLSPFDPLVWERQRTRRLFGFDFRLEIYTPAHKRRHGYYVYPFLHRGRLVARVDLKADRPASVLRVLAAYGEDGASATETSTALARELRRMAHWLDLSQVAAVGGGDLGQTLAGALEGGDDLSGDTA